MSEITGSAVKVRFNNQVYKVQKVSINDQVGKGDITHSEVVPDGNGIVRTVVLPTTGTCTIRLVNASYDPVENQWVLPMNMCSGTFAELTVFPDGLTSEPWFFPNFLVTSGNHEFDVNNLQPVTIEGQNSGIYFQPGQAP